MPKEKKIAFLQVSFSDWATKSPEELFKILKSSSGGLSQKEARKRLNNFGYNELQEKAKGLYTIFLRQFKSPFIYLLIIASAISAFVGEINNSIIIILFVLINLILSFLQEARAQRASDLLKKYLPSKATVLREGKAEIIDKKLLVPGDVVLLELGNVVAADLRILEIQDLNVDESVLTGESIWITKIKHSLSKPPKEIFEAKNILFAGTSIVLGKALGIVINTGRNTALGKITKLVAGIQQKSNFEKDLLKFSKLILRTVIVTIIAIFIANLIIKGHTNFLDFLVFCIALIVGIIPEALPTVVTFALSKGAIKLAKDKVIIKRLSAIEDLGNIEILCADKTGTLTENQLTFENIFSYNTNKCFLFALLSSHFIKKEGIVVGGYFDDIIFKNSPQEIKNELIKYKLITEIPFNPAKLFSSFFLENEDGKKFLIIKGAPEKILKKSSEFPYKGTMEEIKTEIENKGKDGKRTIAIAFKVLEKENFTEHDEKDMTFLGYFSFTDPLKKTAQETIHLAQKLGVQIKVITGDSKEVSKAIAQEAGLIKDYSQVILGEELESLPKDEFKKACEKFVVFARISPQIKYKIIESLQEKYNVGFLGEGINDAPALKISNVGISVDQAVDVAREASDIILLKKDLKVIISGIKEGRIIFSNINKYIKCTMASIFGNYYSLATISLLIPFLPMLPIQILLLNLLSDFPMIAISSDTVDIEELKRPEFYQLNKMVVLIIMLALTSTVFDFIFFGIFRKTSPDMLRTLWFIESAFTEIVLIYSVRTSGFFLKAKFPSLPLIAISILVGITVLVLPFTNLGENLFQFVPPSNINLLVISTIVICYFFSSEVIKLIFFWTLKKEKNDKN